MTVGIWWDKGEGRIKSKVSISDLGTKVVSNTIYCEEEIKTNKEIKDKQRQMCGRNDELIQKILCTVRRKGAKIISWFTPAVKECLE